MRHTARACAALAACTGALSPALAQSRPRPLVIKDDQLPGIGTVFAVADIAVNDAGSWATKVSTNYPDPNADLMILRNDQVAMREGDPIPGTGYPIGFMGNLWMNSAGSVAMQAGLRGAPAATDSAILVDGALVLRKGTAATAPGLPPNSIYTNFYRVELNDSDQLLVPAILTGSPGTGYTMMRVDYNPAQGTHTETVMARVGQSFPGLGVADQILLQLNRASLNNAGDVAFTPLTGNYGGVYIRRSSGNLETLLTPGGASPLPGYTWNNGAGSFVALGAGGASTVEGLVSTGTSFSTLLAHTAAPFHRQGDPLPGLADCTITGFAPDRGQRLADDGRVLWFATWAVGGLAHTGLFLGDRLLVEAGSTIVQTSYGPLTVKSFASTSGFLSVSALSHSGRWVGFTAVLTDGAVDRQAALLIDTEEPLCYANCDGSSAPPVLNVADFTCYLQRFAAGNWYANCDASTTAPTLNVADFTCFLQRFAAGCP